MFDIDFPKRYEAKAHVKKFFLYPQNWVDTTNRITTNLNWSRHLNYCPIKILHIKKEHEGCLRLIDEKNTRSDRPTLVDRGIE